MNTMDRIERLGRLRKELAKAKADSLKWCERAALAPPRSGPRGGRRTGIQAKWARAAEYRDRIQDEIWALEEAPDHIVDSNDMVPAE